MKIEEISIRRIDRERERETETKRHLKRYYCALCIFSFEVSRSSFSSFPRDDDDLNFRERLMGPRERHRIIIIIIIIAFCRCTREEEKHSRGEKKRERERGIKRERKLFVPFLCVRVYLCACASSGVFVYLNIALCAVCAHATRSALRSEEKTLEFVTKRKTLSRYHTLSR